MSADEIVIRTFQPGDDAEILAIALREFEAVASIDARIEAMIGGASWKRVKADAIHRELKDNPGACAVALAGGKRVGFVTNTINRVACRGVIANLAVDSDWQGRGIGRRLIDWSLAYFRSLGLQQAKIETLAPNKAGCHLYPRMGFREVVRQVHYVMEL